MTHMHYDVSRAMRLMAEREAARRFDPVYLWSPEQWLRASAFCQRCADRRRIAETNRRDERPMVVGLALLAVLAISTFCLIVVGLLT